MYSIYMYIVYLLIDYWPNLSFTFNYLETANNP